MQDSSGILVLKKSDFRFSKSSPIQWIEVERSGLFDTFVLNLVRIDIATSRRVIVVKFKHSVSIEKLTHLGFIWQALMSSSL